MFKWSNKMNYKDSVNAINYNLYGGISFANFLTASRDPLVIDHYSRLVITSTDITRVFISIDVDSSYGKDSNSFRIFKMQVCKETLTLLLNFYYYFQYMHLSRKCIYDYNHRYNSRDSMFRTSGTYDEYIKDNSHFHTHCYLYGNRITVVTFNIHETFEKLTINILFQIAGDPLFKYLIDFYENTFTHRIPIFPISILINSLTLP